MRVMKIFHWTQGSCLRHTTRHRVAYNSSKRQKPGRAPIFLTCENDHCGNSQSMKVIQSEPKRMDTAIISIRMMCVASPCTSLITCTNQGSRPRFLRQETSERSALTKPLKCSHVVAIWSRAQRQMQTLSDEVSTFNPSCL